MTDEVLTTREVAELMGVHTNTVKRLGNRGELRFLRVTSRGDRRYLRSDVEKMMIEFTEAFRKGKTHNV